MMPSSKGWQGYMEPVDPREIEHLEALLRQFENTGEDTKLAHFIATLRQELVNRESAIAFTQYNRHHGLPAGAAAGTLR